MDSRISRGYKLQAFCKHRASAGMSPCSALMQRLWTNQALSHDFCGTQRNALTHSRRLITHSVRRPDCIAAYLGKGDRFDQAIADFAAAYADRNERDRQALVQSIADGKIAAVARV
jgi:Uncharacterized protein conserved in bacteria (DUF2252)